MTKKQDNRHNWITLQFVTKCRYNCFRRQSVIDSCIAGFKELEGFGFEFGEMGFPLNHAHILLNLSKKYSVQDAIVKVKCAKCGKKHNAVIENVRKKQAFKNDSFFCGECGDI